MKGVGWIVIMLALLAAVYLVAKDLDTFRGDRDGRAVVEPMERARETVDLARKTQDQLKKALDGIDR